MAGDFDGAGGFGAERLTLHPTPCNLHPTPYTLHLTPCTLHPTPYTLHPTPYTLHLTPDTLNLKLRSRGGGRARGGAAGWRVAPASRRLAKGVFFFFFFITLKPRFE